MIPREMKNPFLAQCVDDAVTLPAGHVPELHADVLSRCLAALGQARQAGQKLGLLVVGEAGSGKSHLIAHCRQHLASDPRAVLVCIRLYGAHAGRLWRHIREQFVTELLRGYPSPAHGANGLLRALRNRFPGWAAATQGPSGGLLDWLVGRSTSAGDLHPHLEELARTCPLDYGLVKVLPKLASPDLSSLAHAWLRGDQLGPDDLLQLGLPASVPSDAEQEAQARGVVLSLLRLAGEETTLMACFDQVEAMMTSERDEVVLRQFTTVATDILAEPGPRVVATFIRPSSQLAIQKANVPANVEKMAQQRAVIPTLNWEQALRVVRARLAAEPTCQVARERAGHGPDWPLEPRFLEETFRQNHRCLTPRHLLRACATEFERLQKGSVAPSPNAGELADGPPPARPGPGGPPASPGPRVDDYSRLWDRQRRKLLEKLQGIHFDTVMAIGLPWLVALTEAPLVHVQDTDDRLGDVNLRFAPTSRGGRSVGISLCNQQPRVVWHRLDRLLKQWKAVKGRGLGSLVVVRSETERTTEGAVARLEALRQAGARVVPVARQQLAELAAFQAMLTAALEGDMTRNGKPVCPEEYDDWARGHLSDAVKELFDQVFELGGANPAVASAVRPRAAARN